ncbi:MAG: NUDIX hydrolase [Phycisphaerales bacterium]
MGKQRTDASDVVIQAGVIPYRIRTDGHLQVLLVTNRAGGWIVPKGSIEPGQTAEESARIEALEEAGAVGLNVEAEIGSYEYEKYERCHRVRLFAMRVVRTQNQWDERDFRIREWVGVDEAIRRVRIEGLRDVLERFDLSMQTRRAG